MASIALQRALGAGMIGAMAGAAAGQMCTWEHLEVPPLHPGSASLVYHGGLQKLLLIGHGHDSHSPLLMWAWDGSAWIPIPSQGLSRRPESEVVYDSARDRLVLFGGRIEGVGIPTWYPSETWEWAGGVWTHINIASPIGRVGHRMAYDEARQRTVLFGGRGPFGQTMEWDGELWRFVSETGPVSRSDHAMAYDSQRAVTVLYSGQGTVPLDDVWEWDGAEWTQRIFQTPGAQGMRMVFDPARARMLVRRGSVLAPQTWEFDPAGGLWLQRDPAFAPTQFAFDATGGGIIGLREGGTVRYIPAGTLHRPYFLSGPNIQQYPVVGARVTIGVDAAGSAPLSYRWRRDQVPLVDGGRISGAATPELVIDPWDWQDAAWYDVVVTNMCASVISAGLFVTGGCYPDCDGSSVPPRLNIDDFTCFIHEFAASQALPHAQQVVSYANCDLSTIAPALNVDDFTCFINFFAAGCP